MLTQSIPNYPAYSFELNSLAWKENTPKEKDEWYAAQGGGGGREGDHSGATTPNEIFEVELGSD